MDKVKVQYVMSYKQSTLTLKYIYIWLYTSCEMEKPSGVSSVKWKAWGISRESVAATWSLETDCMYDCGSIRLDNFCGPRMAHSGRNMSSSA